MIQNSFPPNSIPSTWPTDKLGRIVLFRTTTGDDVIAETLVRGRAYLVKNPMIVQGVQLAGPKSLHILLIPWNPLASVASTHCIYIDRIHILFTTTIDEPLQDYYRKCVEQSPSMVKNSKLSFGISNRVINMIIGNTDSDTNQDEDDSSFHTFH